MVLPILAISEEMRLLSAESSSIRCPFSAETPVVGYPCLSVPLTVEVVPLKQMILLIRRLTQWLTQLDCSPPMVAVMLHLAFRSHGRTSPPISPSYVIFLYSKLPTNIQRQRSRLLYSSCPWHVGSRTFGVPVAEVLLAERARPSRRWRRRTSHRHSTVICPSYWSCSQLLISHRY